MSTLPSENQLGLEQIPDGEAQAIAKIIARVIRCRFIFSGKNDELTPDFHQNDELTPDFHRISRHRISHDPASGRVAVT